MTRQAENLRILTSTPTGPNPYRTLLQEPDTMKSKQRKIGTEFSSKFGDRTIWRVIDHQDIERIGEVRGHWKHYNDGRRIPSYSLLGRIIRRMSQWLGKLCQGAGGWLYDKGR